MLLFYFRNFSASPWPSYYLPTWPATAVLPLLLLLSCSSLATACAVGLRRGGGGGIESQVGQWNSWNWLSACLIVKCHSTHKFKDQVLAETMKYSKLYFTAQRILFPVWFSSLFFLFCRSILTLEADLPRGDPTSPPLLLLFLHHSDSACVSAGKFLRFDPSTILAYYAALVTYAALVAQTFWKIVFFSGKLSAWVRGKSNAVQIRSSIGQLYRQPL